MPETRFKIQWSDGAQETCYSPSSVVRKYFTPGQDYDLEDFVDRVRTALGIASDRVRAKYGRPCGLALGQIEEIEVRAEQYREAESSTVRVLGFIEDL
jgi:uncharacterized repeat protein (TIGR04042 family)